MSIVGAAGPDTRTVGGTSTVSSIVSAGAVDLGLSILSDVVGLALYPAEDLFPAEDLYPLDGATVPNQAAPGGTAAANSVSGQSNVSSSSIIGAVR